MKLTWFTLIFFVSNAFANDVVSDLLAEFEQADTVVESCGSAILLDGGSQLFCFETGDGARLNITLGQTFSSDSQLTFYVVVFGGNTHKLDWSSAEENRLLAVMRSWLDSGYSIAEIDHLRWRLDSLLTDSSATSPLTENEKAVLLVADLSSLLATRIVDE